MNAFTKLIALGTLAALSVPAAQAQVTDTASVSVRTDDLNLASDSGQNTLARRIGHAADKVCNTNEGALDINARRAVAKCRKAAISAAMNSVASNRQVNTLAAAPK